MSPKTRESLGQAMLGAGICFITFFLFSMYFLFELSESIEPTEGYRMERTKDNKVIYSGEQTGKSGYSGASNNPELARKKKIAEEQLYQSELRKLNQYYDFDV